jgi:sodium-dependent dicarboxylate transporter 2/3/5
MIRLVGGSGGARLVFAFMLTAALLSMWISNGATVLMLTPMALAVIARSEDPRLAVPLLLGIAYSASIGGMGTLIGTPPNVIFAGIYERTTGEEYGFMRWMETGLPIVAGSADHTLAHAPARRRAADRAPTIGPWRQRAARPAGVRPDHLAWITR